MHDRLTVEDPPASGLVDLLQAMDAADIYYGVQRDWPPHVPLPDGVMPA